MPLSKVLNYYVATLGPAPAALLRARLREDSGLAPADFVGVLDSKRSVL